MPETNTPQSLTGKGWKPRELPGFIGLAGPLWTRREGDAWAYGLFVEDRHLNPAGRAHGGALMTLIDHAISAVAWEFSGRKACVTLQMDCQFMAALAPGQFAEVRVDITHQTGGLVFARGTLTADSTPVMAAQAVLRKLSS
ncbi:MAG: PaaI family thioesterase [Burkholderiaceae bacterium]